MAEALILPTEHTGVILQELTTDADDLAYFEAVRESPEHVDNFGNKVASSYDELQKVKDRRLTAGSHIRMGIWTTIDFAGSISARPNEAKTEAEIGYWLRKSATGNGYATLAVRALTAHVTPLFPRVFAEVHEENTNSANVLIRAGYEKVNEDDRYWGHVLVFEPLV